MLNIHIFWMYTCMYVWIHNILPFLVEIATDIFLNCIRSIWSHRGTKGILLFFQNTQTLHSKGVATPLICLPLPYMEGIVLICNIDLYCVIAIFNGHR